ncbi:MAG: VTT domain-containing protein [Gammaproteobacteria bacterium]|nr:VTT domain-containing protein [Gammaproteobacteria bacterium]
MPLRHINTVWLAIVAIVLLMLLVNPELVSRESISEFLSGLGTLALLVYILVSLTRAALMIPSTPFVLAGAISFPDMPIVVWIISAAGVVVGAFLVYSFPSFGSYDEYLEEKYPDKIAFLKEKMQGNYAFWIIAGWAFFPLVPTDAVCYVAGMAKMSYKKMIIPLLVGQLPLATVYIFLGTEIGEWLRL